MPEPINRSRFLSVLATFLASILMITACTYGKEAGMQPTMTRNDAIERVEALIDQATRQLPGKARLEVGRQSDSFPCDDPDDGGPKGRVFVEHDYWVRDLSKPYKPYFDALAEYWTDRGYRKARFTKRDVAWTMVYEDAEGFYVWLETTGDGEQLLVGSQSPCVWPNGTPEPETE